MIIANKPLNKQALILEEAEIKIREKAKDEYIKQTPKTALNKKIGEIIRSAMKYITIPELKKAAVISLWNFYERQYKEISRIYGHKLLILLAFMTLTKREVKGQIEGFKGIGEMKAKEILKNNGYDRAKLYGQPLHKYMKDYMEKDVAPILDKMAKQFPLDPGDISGRNSLRNRAEMEVRYNNHLAQIDELKEAGHKLIICSTHADCSKRCAPWQGRVYSLDRTSGKTDDGRDYVPLEVATDVWYTTKAGKRYKNGLLGFNCRHYLVPYKSGYRFPKPNPKEEREEYKITLRQRQLERNVRRWRTEAVTNKGVNRERYLKAREKAIKWNKAYIDYSKEHGRAYYPSRTKLL